MLYALLEYYDLSGHGGYSSLFGQSVSTRVRMMDTHSRLSALPPQVILQNPDSTVARLRVLDGVEKESTHDLGEQPIKVIVGTIITLGECSHSRVGRITRQNMNMEMEDFLARDRTCIR